jgi:hypothetical protein
MNTISSKMVTVTAAFSPLEDGGELAAACHACLTLYGAQMLEFGPWHDDDDEPPWFCTLPGRGRRRQGAYCRSTLPLLRPGPNLARHEERSRDVSDFWRLTAMGEAKRKAGAKTVYFGQELRDGYLVDPRFAISIFRKAREGDHLSRRIIQASTNFFAAH